MSPEQAAGRLDLLGPVSDVYSLGATLYYVLTGRPPIEAGDVGTVLKKVQSGEFRPPRAVNPEIPRPLDAICLKAMSLKPEDRYGSPKALADDIEHWLADEPVTACRERWPARAARWARKHKTLVVGAFGLAVATIIALAVSTVLVKRQQVLTEAARQQSQRSFQLSRDAINELCNDVASDVLLSVPGVQPVREKLLQKAKKYYEKLRQLNSEGGVTGGDIAATNYRLARIYELLGKNDDARTAYEDARKCQETLYRQAPSDPAALEDFGDTLNALAAFEQTQKHYAKAADYYEKAIEVRKKLADLSPEKGRLLANTLMNRGLLNKDRLTTSGADQPAETERSGVYRSALRDFDEAQQIRGRLLKQYPSDVALQRDAAQGDCNMAGLEMLGGLVEPPLTEQHCNEARKCAESAAGRFRAILDTAPVAGQGPINRLDLQCDLLASQRLAADIQIYSHRRDAGPELYDGIVNELTTLAAQNPNVPRFRVELATALQHQGNAVMAQKGEKAATEALKIYRRCEEVMQQLVGEYPDKSAYRDAMTKIRGKIREAQQRRDGRKGSPPAKPSGPNRAAPPS
jgi:serine/threonine-protein kinase